MADLTPWQQALLYENCANPYPFYAELRKTPVSRQPDGSYVISTYQEIVSILHDPRVSSDPRNRAKPSSAGVEAPNVLTSTHDREPSMITRVWPCLLMKCLLKAGEVFQSRGCFGWPSDLLAPCISAGLCTRDGGYGIAL
jgi:hypothetical protein